MTDGERYEIATLATAYDEARQRYEYLAATNHPTDPLKRAELSAAYYLAQTEMMEAHAVLLRAQGRIASK